MIIIHYTHTLTIWLYKCVCGRNKTFINSSFLPAKKNIIIFGIFTIFGWCLKMVGDSSIHHWLDWLIRVENKGNKQNLFVKSETLREFFSHKSKKICKFRFYLKVFFTFSLCPHWLINSEHDFWCKWKTGKCKTEKKLCLIHRSIDFKKNQRESSLNSMFVCVDN